MSLSPFFDGFVFLRHRVQLEVTLKVAKSGWRFIPESLDAGRALGLNSKGLDPKFSKCTGITVPFIPPPVSSLRPLGFRPQRLRKLLLGLFSHPGRVML